MIEKRRRFKGWMGGKDEKAREVVANLVA